MVLIDWRNHVLRWVFWAIIACVPLVWMRGPRVLFVVGPLALLLVGLSVVGRPGEVARTPVSFCLPGFRESLRRRYFSGAAVMGLAGVLLVLKWNLSFTRQAAVLDRSDLTEVYLQVVAGFLAGMAAALIVATPRLILPRLAWNVLRLLGIPLFVIAIAALTVLIRYPTVGIPVCAGICVFVWLQLGEKAILKRGHRRIIEDAIEQRHETAPQDKTARRLSFIDVVTVPPWAEALFRGWMQSRPYLSAGRYIWGALYEVFGPWFSRWESILFGLAAAALVLGLLGNKVAPGIALIYFAFAFRMIRLPVTSTLLLPGGRREKCHATFAMALAASALLLGAAVLVVVLARVGALLVSGAFPKGGVGVPHDTTGLAGIFLPFILVPTTLGIQLRQEEGGWITPVALVLSIASLFLLLFWQSTWPQWWAFVLLAVMFVFGWVFFLFVLRAACQRWDMG